MNDNAILSIVVTFPSRVAAEECGQRLVRAGLAACAQLDGPVTSIYRWRGAVEVAEEWRMTCKTTPALETACVGAILSAHAYETPQITVARQTASVGYASWIRESVGGT